MRSMLPHLLLFIVAVALATAAGVVAGPGKSPPGGWSAEDEAPAVEGDITALPIPRVPPALGRRPPGADPFALSGDPTLSEPLAESATGGSAKRIAKPPSPLGRLSGEVWMWMPLSGIDPVGLTDTFAEERGGRRHEALDIHVPRGTPVLAAEGGRVQKIWESVPGGHTVYLLGAGGRFRYYYAHLEGYRAGLAEGEQVRAGEVIGYVGDSGNAVPGDTHLHFGVFLVDDPEDWSGGKAVNPLPYLRHKKPLLR